MNDPILTSREAAKLLGVSVRTAQTWIESQVMKSWKTPGGHRRVFQSDVLALKATLPDVLSVPPNSVTPRIAALARVSDADVVFDAVTALAAAVTGMPIALITVLTHSQQWFRSRYGLNIERTPRSWAFCNFAILQNDVMEVSDAMADVRFKANPLVTGVQHIRAYAGAPISDYHGNPVGTLCVLDTSPRSLTRPQLSQLKSLALLVSAELTKSVGRGEPAPETALHRDWNSLASSH